MQHSSSFGKRPGETYSVSAERIAVITAGHTGDMTVATSGLSSSEPAVRIAALGALHRMNAISNEHVQMACHDTDPQVVARAIELTPHTPPDPKTDHRLVELLDAADDIAEVAAWALGERHQRSMDPEIPKSVSAVSPAHLSIIVSALISVATSHADALVREAAVAALGCIGDPSSLPAIIAGCEDKATVRRRAVIALAAFEGPLVDAALEHARHDRDWQVRQAAEDLLS